MADTEVSALPDSGVLSDTALIPASVAGVGKSVLGSRFVRTDANGSAGLGVTPPAWSPVAFGIKNGAIWSFASDDFRMVQNLYFNGASFIYRSASPACILTLYQNTLQFAQCGTGAAGAAAATSQVFTIDGSGNVLAGTTSGTAHRFVKAGAEGAAVISFDNNTSPSAVIYSVAGGGYNAAATALLLGKNNSTGRSINAGGTVNASGADLAEYMFKAAGCGPIAKGDVCGVTRVGRLTRKWADMIAPVVKTTDPHVVGGDIWGADVGEPPGPPVYEAPAYDGPPEPVAPEPLPEATLPDVPPEPEPPAQVEGGDQGDYLRRVADYVTARAEWSSAGMDAVQLAADRRVAEAKYETAVARYEVAIAAWNAAQAAHGEAVTAAEAAFAEAEAQHVHDLAGWQDDHEAARAGVDRISFCGRVPVNFAGDCEPGDYLVAVQVGSGIGLNRVAQADMTLPDYMLRVGRVWSIGEDGRPIIDVQHG